MRLTFHLIIKEAVLKIKITHLMVIVWVNKSSIAFIDVMSENFSDKNVHLKLSLLFSHQEKQKQIPRRVSYIQGKKRSHA